MDQHAVALYDRDFYLWTQTEAAKLRRAGEARLNLDLDFDNLAEEVEDMGKSHLLAFESELARVLEHLLKLEFSPADHPCRGWRAGVRIHRFEAARHLDDSPSLRARVRLAKVFTAAIRVAERSFIDNAGEAGDLPADCPYTLDQILDDAFFPTNRHGLTN